MSKHGPIWDLIIIALASNEIDVIHLKPVRVCTLGGSSSRANSASLSALSAASSVLKTVLLPGELRLANSNSTHHAPSRVVKDVTMKHPLSAIIGNECQVNCVTWAH